MNPPIAEKPYAIHFRETIALSIPVVIGQVGTLLMNVSDNIMIGNVSYLHLSAASLANSCYIIITVLAIGAMNAIAPLVAESYGAKRDEKTGDFLFQGVYAAFFIGWISCGATYLFAELLPFLGQPEAEVELAQSYLRIISFSTPPMIIFLAYKQFCDGLSNTRAGMLITIAGLLLNILFNWFLIYGHWIFPRLELEGSAYSTLLSRFLIAAIIIFHVHFGKKYHYYLQLSKRWIYQGSVVRQIMRLGLPMGFQIFFEVGAFAGATLMIGWLGNATEARAAHQIVLNFAALSFMVSLGLGVGG
ncbi:MAG: MATE family efflux transporter, partial [Bacteroidetes bacterium]|nr:MATE family efflux transporter [Bacteroidota bacterium]